MASLLTSTTPSLAPQPLRTPFAPLCHSRRNSHSRPSSESKNAMATPLASRTSSSLHVQRHIHSSAGSNSTDGSPGASFGSDSEDDENDIPPTPGDDRFSPLRLDHGLKLQAPTPVRNGLNGVELNHFFDAREDEASAGVETVRIKPSHPTDQLLSASAKSFFPSFGDFLPSIRQQEEERQADLKAQGLGLGLWSPPNKENDLDQLASRTSGLSFHTRHSSSETNAPLAHSFAGVASPETDSFTFFPSPGFQSHEGSSAASTHPTSTSSSLLSPEPAKRSTFPAAQEAQVASSHRPTHTQGQSQRQRASSRRPLSISVAQLPGFPATPPRTPVRTTFGVAHPHPHPHPHASLYPAHAPQVRGGSLPPTAYYAIPVSLPPTPTSLAIPITTVGGFYAPSPSLVPLAIPVPVSIARSVSPAAPAPITGTSASTSGGSDGYPLSPADTDRIAKLHNGRIPTAQQLAPPEVVPTACQQPIVNTGNQGPMVVQAGDWRCGVCAFVNWRRRKICLRCFPYANDIGDILTIQSQRAAHLAAPSSAHSSTSAPPSASGPTFTIQPALPAYSGGAALSASASGSDGVPSAHLAAAAMARSSTYPPASARSFGSSSGGYGSLAHVEQGYPAYPYANVQPQAQAPASYRQSSMPTSASAYFSASPQHQQAPAYPQSQPQPQASLSPVIWNDDPLAASRFSDSSSSSGGALSATSAGEHALLRAQQQQRARVAAAQAAAEKAGVRMFPALSAPAPPTATEDGWERAARSGYVAPGLRAVQAEL
ncbi:hypothetical protein JCM10207_008605 [Rhodosporidiobolus poonsookiae]